MSKNVSYYAKYPFLPDTQSVIDESEITLDEALSDENIIEQTTTRITDAVYSRSENEIHTESRYAPDNLSDAEELITYPISRLFISVIDQDGLVTQFGKNEAERAIYNIENDTTTKDEIFNEFNIPDGTIERVSDPLFDYRVRIGFFVDNTPDNPQYALPNRLVKDGYVYIVERGENSIAVKDGEMKTRKELTELLSSVIENKVTKDLPLDVPRGVYERVSEKVTGVTDKIQIYDRERSETPPDSLDEIPHIDRGKPNSQQNLVLSVMELYEYGYSTDEIVSMLPDGTPEIVIQRIVDGGYLPPSEKTVETATETA